MRSAIRMLERMCRIQEQMQRSLDDIEYLRGYWGRERLRLNDYFVGFQRLLIRARSEPGIISRVEIARWEGCCALLMKFISKCDDKLSKELPLVQSNARAVVDMFRRDVLLNPL